MQDISARCVCVCSPLPSLLPAYAYFTTNKTAIWLAVLTDNQGTAFGGAPLSSMVAGDWSSGSALCAARSARFRGRKAALVIARLDRLEGLSQR